MEKWVSVLGRRQGGGDRPNKISRRGQVTTVRFELPRLFNSRVTEIDWVSLQSPQDRKTFR